MKEKVILNKDYTEIFLSLAFQEGLLYADKTKNDHVYERYKTNQIDFHLTKSLLEQLLLSPFPLLRKKLHESVEGNLIEEGIIHFDDREIERIIPMDRYPTELYLGILKGNGVELTKESFRDIINDIVTGKKEYDELEMEFGGKLPDLDGFGKAFRKMLMESGLEMEEEEVEDDRHERLRALNNRAKINLDKVSSVLEFLQLKTIAEEHNAAIKVKAEFNDILTNLDNLGKIENIENNQGVVLRLVEKEFGHISLRTNSLKETLQLAQTPEFIAYRMQQDEWINRLISGQYDELDKIRNEIRTARRYIELKPMVQRGGDILAFFGIPLALITLPTPIGVALSIAGIMPFLTNFGLEKKYKWAMINQVNK